MLLTELRRCRDGRPGAVLVGGEAGVGKSRLVGEFTARARADGATVLAGDAIEVADAAPLWPVIAAVRRAARPEGRDPAAGPLATALARLTGDDDGPRQPVELLDTLHRLLVSLAEHTPVVLVLEDLQWADRSTCDLIGYLVANLGTEPVLVVGTYRTDPGDPLADSAPMLTELRRHRTVADVRLAPLARAAVGELVSALAPGRPDLEPLVWRRCAGNAFIAEETVRAVLDGDADGLPSTLRDLVLGRVRALSAPARRVVRACAVSSGPLPHRLLERVLDDGPTDLLDAVREAVESGSVVVNDDRDGYRLRHGLMVEVVAADLLPGERIDLHRRFATALAATDPARDRTSARLAHHWSEAGEPGPALVATVAAARDAERVQGHAEAHRHWARAATLTGAVGGPVDGLPTGPQCLDRAAQAAERAGEHEAAVGLLDRLLHGADESAGPGGVAAGPDGVAAALLTARKGGSLAAAGRGRDAGEVYRRAATLLPAEGFERERAVVLAGYGGTLLQAGDFGTARDVAGRALGLARAAGTRTVEARVLAVLGFSLAYLEDPGAGVAALDEALAVAEGTGEPAAIGDAYLRRADLLSGPLNQLDDGVRCARAGVGRMDELGLPRTAGVALLSCAANGLFRAGHWAQARELVVEAWSRRPTGAVALEVRLARCRLDLAVGLLDRAADDLAAVELLAERTVGARYRLPLTILRVALELWRGRPADALAHVEAGLDLVEAGADEVWLVAPLLWHGTWAWADCAWSGRPSEPARAERLRRHCAELESRGAGAAAAVRELVAPFDAMCRGETARAGREPDPEPWRVATERWEYLGQPYPAAYARLRRAEALLSRRSRSADAAAELTRAAERARELGARPLLARIRELATRARVPVDAAAEEAATTNGPSPVDGTGPVNGSVARNGPVAGVPAPRPPATELDRLTRREREVLEVMATGLTNKEIAERLFISEKTVGVHLARVFAKIGVHTRVQASAVLHRSRDAARPPDRG